MGFLLDTNVWLERLLDREKSVDVDRFLKAVPADQIQMTDFTLHSIGIIMNRMKRHGIMLRFIEDLFVNGGIALVRLEPAETGSVIACCDRFGLDFDDAYQYVAAESRDLVLVSFDSDFDKTERGRKAPGMIREP